MSGFYRTRACIGDRDFEHPLPCSHCDRVGRHSSSSPLVRAAEQDRTASGRVFHSSEHLQRLVDRRPCLAASANCEPRACYLLAGRYVVSTCPRRSGIDRAEPCDFHHLDSTRQRSDQQLDATARQLADSAKSVGILTCGQCRRDIRGVLRCDGHGFANSGLNARRRTSPYNFGVRIECHHITKRLKPGKRIRGSCCARHGSAIHAVIL